MNDIRACILCSVLLTFAASANQSQTKTNSTSASKNPNQTADTNTASSAISKNAVTTNEILQVQDTTTFSLADLEGKKLRAKLTDLSTGKSTEIPIKANQMELVISRTSDHWNRLIIEEFNTSENTWVEVFKSTIAARDRTSL